MQKRRIASGKYGIEKQGMGGEQSLFARFLA